MRARSGFTLIEIMIALALAGLVVGGALQLHASFNRHAERQAEIADMQQTLRVAMLMMERYIRSAGDGLPGGKIVEGSVPTIPCGVPSPPTHWGFRWWDKNASRDDSTDYQTDGTYVDPTPDSFAVITANAPNQAPPSYFAQSDTTGSSLTLLTTNPMTAPSGKLIYGVGHDDGNTLFAIIFPPGAQCASGACSKVYFPQVQPVSVQLPNKSFVEQYSYCVRELTAIVSGTGTALAHTTSGAKRCLNPSAASDDCAKAVGQYASSANYPTVRRIDAVSTMFRVMTSDDPLNANTVAGATPSPKLTMRTAPWGTAENAPGSPWTIIADNIDDMQLALVMNDGTVQNRLDNPVTYDSTRAFAVRVTLRARSSSPISGLGVQPNVGAEDELVGAPGDDAQHRYLRRSLTAEIELRNMRPDNP
jgi:prepilin-type N-terminal cleavage/methylation domain-containing protein